MGPKTDIQKAKVFCLDDTAFVYIEKLCISLLIASRKQILSVEILHALFRVDKYKPKRS